MKNGLEKVLNFAVKIIYLAGIDVSHYSGNGTGL